MTGVDLAAIRARADTASPGPWGVAYSAVVSTPLVAGYDAWLGPLLDAGHSLDRVVCVPCNAAVCAYVREMHDRDPVVATVPAACGDTPTRRRGADAVFIAAARTDVEAMLAEVERLRAVVYDMDTAIGFETRCTGCAATLAGAMGETHRAEKAEAQRDALRHTLGKTIVALTGLLTQDPVSPGNLAECRSALAGALAVYEATGTRSLRPVAAETGPGVPEEGGTP